MNVQPANLGVSLKDIDPKYHRFVQRDMNYDDVSGDAMKVIRPWYDMQKDQDVPVGLHYSEVDQGKLAVWKFITDARKSYTSIFDHRKMHMVDLPAVELMAANQVVNFLGVLSQALRAKEDVQHPPAGGADPLSLLFRPKYSGRGLELSDAAKFYGLDRTGRSSATHTVLKRGQGPVTNLFSFLISNTAQWNGGRLNYENNHYPLEKDCTTGVSRFNPWAFRRRLVTSNSALLHLEREPGVIGASYEVSRWKNRKLEQKRVDCTFHPHAEATLQNLIKSFGSAARAMLSE